MVSLEEALEIARKDQAEGPEAHRDGVWGEDIRETPSGWYFPIFFIGSVGRMVSKVDGAVYLFGSAFPVETWLWAYERGFRSNTYDFVVTEVADLEATRDFLAPRLAHPGIDYTPLRGPSAEVLRTRLGKLPATFVNQCLERFLPDFQSLESSSPFAFRTAPDSRMAAPSAPRAWLDPLALPSIARNEALAGKIRQLFDEGRLELLMSATERAEYFDPLHAQRATRMKEQRRLDGPPSRARRLDNQKEWLTLQRQAEFPVHVVFGKPDGGEPVLKDEFSLGRWADEVAATN